MPKQPKQITAWAVVDKEIDVENLYVNKKDAEWTKSFYQSWFRVIKVRITPIAKGN